MDIHVIEITTEVYHLLQQRAPQFIGWEGEKPGPTQKILVDADVYSEFIDRAIAHRQTLDEVVREICIRPPGSAFTAGGGDHDKRLKKSS